MRIMTSGLAASLLLLGVAHAQSGDRIVIEDFYGTVELELSGSGEISAIKSGPNADEVTIKTGSTTRITGDEEIDRRRWWKEYQNNRKGWSGRQPKDRDRVFEEMLEERPRLTISAPQGTDIEINGSAIHMRTDGSAGDVDITDNVHLLVVLGDVDDAELEIHGSGYLEVGNVAGMLDGSVHGSGDLIAGNIREADLRVHGSGDLNARNVGGEVKASVHGSGDLSLERVLGPVSANVHGSGDLKMNRIERGLKGSVHGSGDLEVNQVNGDLDLSVHGSGDLDIDNGSVDDLDATVYGSGEVTFGGSAKNARLRSTGSGSIRVGRVTGQLDAKGKDIRVDGKKVGEEKKDKDYH
ncbi:hypothetical protein HK107_04370 [Parvularcula sp. ZS-1/3]|uniref:Putative auto-transporter adhesin head GIN domain-containing protein n=1 Tax=Parvularcula mediterranea TaxID=2732508 RepID=A0A7Y3RLI8_9PROT|nr:DUF2807 domain-containing protein [Parvularcula mediterranea]NNU15552.1 hypothetical protein [Parvularcula mediterranea]